MCNDYAREIETGREIRLMKAGRIPSETLRGKPVFHFVSEHRKFTDTERCLILATGFYEYTDPKKPTVKLKDSALLHDEGTGLVLDSGHREVRRVCDAHHRTKPRHDAVP
jgi:putative SOS response-associated peptidase YedK